VQDVPSKSVESHIPGHCTGLIAHQITYEGGPYLRRGSWEPEKQVINFNLINSRRNLPVDQTTITQRLIERVAEDEDDGQLHSLLSHTDSIQITIAGLFNFTIMTQMSLLEEIHRSAQTSFEI